jgi:GTPase SAR1 family protein
MLQTSDLSIVSPPQPIFGMTKLTPDIRTWFQNVEQHATEGVHKILIGNKCDWTEKRVVTEEQGKALAQELGIPFIETSAKSNINVEEAFFSLARYPSFPPRSL